MKVKSSIFNVTIGLSLFLTAATGALAQKVTYNYLPGTDFARYKTYKWVKAEKARYPNELLDGQIMASIDKQLAMKGLSKVAEGIPDLVVVYQVAVDQQQEWNAYSTGGGYWGWGGWYGWGGMGSTTVYSSTITVGTLNLDIYDVFQKRQIWRGEATKTLDPPKDPAKLQKNLDKATAKLLKNYPPPSKK